MRRVSRARVAQTATLAALTTVTVVASLVASEPTARTWHGLVRVNQIGYDLDAPKTGYLLATAREAGSGFAVVDAAGATVLSGTVGHSLGAWNSGYTAVFPIDLSALRTSGTFRVRTTKGDRTPAVSPPFRIARAWDLYPPLAAMMTKFFQVQRDGSDLVATTPARRPSHLADAAAGVYAVPQFTAGDQLAAGLRRIGGPIDVSGGWFDAGDYLKFTATTAYATANLLLASRAGSADPALRAEIDHGLTWLGKMWDPRTGVLYAQVGIGSGDGTFLGDHDMWRLPEADDALAVDPDDPRYHVRYRPVFPANAPGTGVSPNLAGRVVAAFALAAQAHATSDPTRARTELDLAASLYQATETSGQPHLVTAYPAAYYPETAWADDLEFGAVQLAMAARALGDPRYQQWLSDGLALARIYHAQRETGADERQSLNFYDVSALAHMDLMVLLAGTGSQVEWLAGDVRDQLATAAATARLDRFRAGMSYQQGDATARAFGLITSAVRYREITGDHDFDTLATDQAGWVLGANPWGTSLVIGAGSVYPACPQHQIANLARDTAGGPVLAGAAVNGPTAASEFSDQEGMREMRACPADGADPFGALTGNRARYRDTATAWQSVEPTIDATSAGLLAFTLLGR